VSASVCIGRPFRSVMTFCTVSSRADTARTRRRLFRPALAPASLRERAGRLARDTVARMCGCCVVASGTGRRGLCGAAPPASSPLTRPDPCGPSARRLWAVIFTVAGDHVEGPHGSGVNGWTPGPLRLLGRLSPAGQGLP